MCECLLMCDFGFMSENQYYPMITRVILIFKVFSVIVNNLYLLHVACIKKAFFIGVSLVGVVKYL